MLRGPRNRRAFIARSPRFAAVRRRTSRGTDPYSRYYTYDTNNAGQFATNNGRAYSYTNSAHPHAVTAAGSDTFGYDANGSQTSRTVGGVSYTVGWNYDNRVTSITNNANGHTSNYIYDPQGNRLIRDDNGTATLYIGGVYEITSVNGATPTTTKYYSLAGQRVAVSTNSGTHLDFQLGDLQGSVVTSYRNDGTNTQRMHYYPFGEQRGTGTAPTDRTWLGQPQDTATGLADLGARCYDAHTGVFLTQDPAKGDGGIQSSNPSLAGVARWSWWEGRGGWVFPLRVGRCVRFRPVGWWRGPSWSWRRRAL